MSVRIRDTEIRYEDIPRVVHEPVSQQLSIAAGVAIIIACLLLIIMLFVGSQRKTSRVKQRDSRQQISEFREPVPVENIYIWCKQVLPFRNIVIIDTDNRVYDFTAYASDVFEARLGHEILAKELILTFDNVGFGDTVDNIDENVVRVRLRDTADRQTWEYHGRLQSGPRTQFFLSTEKLDTVFSNVRRPDTEIYETLRYNHTGRGEQDEYNERRLARIVHG